MVEVESFIYRQLESSPLFYTNFSNMRQSALRTVQFDGFSYTLQMNPARIQSATADISKKPDTSRCFLCRANLIQGQIPYEYSDDFFIAVNPFPIGENHLTIISQRHQDQGIMNIVDKFVTMADDMPGYVVFYNGPKCGASAPFHLHLQACKAVSLPVFAQIENMKRLYAVDCAEFSDTNVYKIDDTTRRFIVVQTMNRSQLQYHIEKLLREINMIYQTAEPEVNVGILFNDGYYTATIFPRDKHRPEEFFRTGADRIVCSPGYADLAGMIPVSVRDNFYSITDNDIRSIMRQVCISSEKFDALHISL